MDAIETNKTQVATETANPLKSIKNDIEAIFETKTGNRENPDINIEKDINNRQIEDIALEINKFLKSIQTDLKVEIHRETHTAIFKIVKKDNDELIREIPPRELLELSANIKKMVGLIFDLDA
jgi:flagellar protein FlaG